MTGILSFGITNAQKSLILAKVNRHYFLLGQRKEFPIINFDHPINSEVSESTRSVICSHITGNRNFLDVNPWTHKNAPMAKINQLSDCNTKLCITWYQSFSDRFSQLLFHEVKRIHRSKSCELWVKFLPHRMFFPTTMMGKRIFSNYEPVIWRRLLKKSRCYFNLEHLCTWINLLQCFMQMY